MTETIPQFKIAAHAVVIRSPESYLKIWREKLGSLPWGEAGFEDWLERPSSYLKSRTPRQAIKDGDGHLAEDIVDELEHLHFGLVALEQLRERFGALTQLAAVWEQLESAKAKSPWAEYVTSFKR